jgi:hypothetical protein
MRVMSSFVEDWPEVFLMEDSEVDVSWSRLPIEPVIGIDELNALEARLNRRRVTVSDRSIDRQTWIERFVDTLAWHVNDEEDEFEDEFVLLMARCVDIGILFEDPTDLEEFVYHLMELPWDERF